MDVFLVPAHLREELAGGFEALPAKWRYFVGTDGAVVPDESTVWHIAIDPGYLNDPLALCIIVVHEYTHGVLAEAGIDKTSGISIELLVEAAMVLLGFGVLLRTLQERVIRGYRDTALTWRVGGPGYLNVLEIEYLLERQASILASAAT